MRTRTIAGPAFLISLILTVNAYGQDYHFQDLVQIEAGYILSCQSVDNPSSPQYGAIKTGAASSLRIEPGAGALGILGLLKAQDIMEQAQGDQYYQRAQLCAEYLLRVQDADGAWFNEYSMDAPGAGDRADAQARAKSPAQTAKVMLALYRLGYAPGRYPAMKRAAQYLMRCQKNGGDGFLLGSGKNAAGVFGQRRGAVDNSFAYQALEAAGVWATVCGEYRFAMLCDAAARRIVKGINTALYIKNPYDPDFGVWYRFVDGQNQPVDAHLRDRANFAVQMLHLPCIGVDHPRVGAWINRNLQKSNGGCVGDNGLAAGRFSPGDTFQAVVCWRALGQQEFYIPALNWSLASGLWQVDGAQGPAGPSVGGWIDWMEAENPPSGLALRAPEWQRFVETSFYAIAAFNGGYDFGIVPAFLRIGYDDPRTAGGDLPYYLKFKLTLPQELQQ